METILENYNQIRESSSPDYSAVLALFQSMTQSSSEFKSVSQKIQIDYYDCVRWTVDFLADAYKNAK